MHRLAPILLLLAAAPIVIPVPVVAEIHPVTPAPRGSAAAIPRPDGTVVFVGGMGSGMTSSCEMGGGMTGGGMGGGMTGGVMGGGMTGGVMGGGMTGGGMGGGMTGGGMGGGMTGGGTGGGGLPAYADPPGSGVGQFYGGDGTRSGGSQPAQNYQCVTQQGHCSVASSPGALRHGASCTCLLGGPGKIK
jgi:hypothetical protein